MVVARIGGGARTVRVFGCSVFGRMRLSERRGSWRRDRACPWGASAWCTGGGGGRAVSARGRRLALEKAWRRGAGAVWVARHGRVCACVCVPGRGGVSGAP
eukprot:scaffold8877_cov112-Isochrysis_galbana.AAC.13